jgi:hypothetical protein
VQKAFISFVTQSASKVCCRSIAACILGPTLVLVPSQATKIKVVGFPTVTGARNRQCTVLTAGRNHKYFAASSANQLIKNIFKTMDQTGSSLRNSQESVLQESKRVVSVSPDTADSSEVQ